MEIAAYVLHGLVMVIAAVLFFTGKIPWPVAAGLIGASLMPSGPQASLMKRMAKKP